MYHKKSPVPRNALALVFTALVLGAGLFGSALGYTVQGNRNSEALLEEARKLMIDSLPEDRDYAEQLLVDVIRMSPHNVDAYAELSRFILWQVSMRYLRPHQLARAASLARHVNELAPERPIGTYLVSEMMMALGQSKQGMDLFESAQKSLPNHPDTLLFEARFYSEREPERAIHSAVAALRLGVPMDSLSPAIAAAFEHHAQTHKSQLAQSLKSFVQIYPDRWLWHRAAQAHLAASQYSEARMAFEEAIKLGNEVESRLQLGILLYEHLDQPAAARTVLNDLLEHLSQRERKRPLALALVRSHLALAELELGHTDAAGSLAAEVFLTTPSNEPMISSVVGEFEKRNKLDVLEPGLRTLVSVNPLLDAAHIILAQISSRKRDHKAVVEHLSHAIAITPDRDDLYAARALARYELKNFEFALADFERAIDIGPTQATHHYNRACMLALLGRTDEALASLREAILMDASFAEMARTDSDLVSLRTSPRHGSQLLQLGVLGEPKQDAQAVTVESIPANPDNAFSKPHP
jgi:tetratricopeptide (TPR) repeat protein